MQSASTLPRPTTSSSTSDTATSRMGPLNYRDRDRIEDRHTEQATRITSPSSTSPVVVEFHRTKDRSSSRPAAATAAATSSINKLMIHGICKSQILMLLGTTMIALWFCHGDMTGLTWFIPSIPKATTTMISTMGDGEAMLQGTGSMILNDGTPSNFWRQIMIVLFQSIAAASPMMGLAGHVEASSRRDASHVQLATTNLVITLFGRRRSFQSHRKSRLQHQENSGRSNTEKFSSSPIIRKVDDTPSATLQMVLFCSLGLAFVAALSEELLFRVYLPTLIMNVTHSVWVAWFGQAILFGLGHWHTSSHTDENRMVVGMQTVNGLWYGLVYLASHGNPGLCILSHWLYDAHVLAHTWNTVNDQMDYTEIAAAYGDTGHPVPGYNIHNRDDNCSISQQQQQQQEEEELAAYCSEVGPALSYETIALCRRLFYAFDTDRVGRLNIHNVQRAISYAFLTDPVAPTQHQVTSIFHQQVNARKGRIDSHYNNDNPRDPNTSVVPVQDSLQSENETRLQFSEFLKLLFSLRALVYQPVATVVSTDAIV